MNKFRAPLLSERMREYRIMDSLDIAWLKDRANEVAQLEEERNNYRTQYHMAEAKITSRDALLEQLSKEQLTQDLAKAEEENKALRRMMPYLMRKADVVSVDLGRQFFLMADEIDALLGKESG